MSFYDWKNRSKIDTWIKDNPEIMRVCELAYKAGERQGRKDLKEITKRANELRELLYIHTRNPASPIIQHQALHEQPIPEN